MALYIKAGPAGMGGEMAAAKSKVPTPKFITSASVAGQRQLFHVMSMVFQMERKWKMLFHMVCLIC